LMKPEHEACIDRLWKILDTATDAVGARNIVTTT